LKSKTNNLKRLAFFYHFTHFILGNNQISDLALSLSLKMDFNNQVDITPKYRQFLLVKGKISRMTLHRRLKTLIDIGFMKSIDGYYIINPIFITKNCMSDIRRIETLIGSYYTSKNMKPKMVDFIVQNYTREAAKRYLKKMEIDI